LAASILERRNLRYYDWGDVLSDIEELKANGYDHAERGNLSLGQICNHLAIVMEAAVDGFPYRVLWPLTTIMRWILLNSMLRLEPTRLRLPAPPFASQKKPVSDEEGAARLRAAIVRFGDPQVTCAKHFAFGRLTRNEWTHQQLWHCEHHLRFLIPKSAERTV